MASPLISVIVPVRNERVWIEGFLDGVFSQQGITELEVIIADGQSDDGTKELLHQRAQADGRLVVLANERKIVSTGLNAAIRAARGDIIVRMDVHTEYAPDYIARCVAVLEATGADNVGGPWRAKGSGYLQSAITLAFQSPFSSGGAGSRRTAHEGPVDSVYLGCWRRDTLLRVGLFDEELVRNQDDELNLRLIRGGGMIWQSPTIKSWYHPRSSLRMLMQQYMQYGYWKVLVIQKHRLPASIRHVVPGGFLGVLLLLALIAPFSRVALALLLVLVALYAAVNLGAAVLTCGNRGNWRYLACMPAVFWIFHFGYAWGFLRGVFDFMLLRGRGRDHYARLTR